MAKGDAEKYWAVVDEMILEGLFPVEIKWRLGREYKYPDFSLEQIEKRRAKSLEQWGTLNLSAKQILHKRTFELMTKTFDLLSKPGRTMFDMEGAAKVLHHCGEVFDKMDSTVKTPGDDKKADSLSSALVAVIREAAKDNTKKPGSSGSDPTT